VKAELAALRRAQAFGETVGADVSVAIKAKNVAGPKVSLGTVPPLYITGWDDCAAFFEVYLNLGTTCCIPLVRDLGKTVAGGKVDEGVALDMASGNNRSQKPAAQQHRECRLPPDIPLLICRGVGPFVNSTMKTLTFRRTVQYASSSPGSHEDSHGYASLEVQGGPILPCAMMQLFRGLAQTMIADRQETPRTDDCNEGEGDAFVSSHSLILRAIPSALEREKGDLAQKHGIVGSSNCELLNTCPSGGSQDERVTDVASNQVPYGHVVGTTVWDILHPDAMAYKLESVDRSTSALSRF
jgi:hypothetical protein